MEHFGSQGAEALLFKLTAKGVELAAPGGGVAEISRMDVCAALGFSRYRDDGRKVRLTRMPYLWALHYFCQDVVTLSELLEGLAIRVSPLREVACKYAEGLARVAVVERVKNNVCRQCFGNDPECRRCRGQGSVNLSKRRKASLAGVPWTTWWRHENEFLLELDFLYQTLGAWEAKVVTHLAAVCFDKAKAS